MALPITGSWPSLYFGDFRLAAGGATFRNTDDFKIMPIPGGALLLPLRILPPGPATLSLPAGVSIAAPAAITTYEQALVFGLPCLLAPHCPAATNGARLPP